MEETKGNTENKRWFGWKSCVVAALSMLLYWYPSPIDPQPFTFPSPLPRLEGALEKNSVLQRAKRLFENDVTGPESFARDAKGRIFTGTADGRILSISNGNFTVLARTGLSDPRCGSYEFEPLCGRPKGMKVWRDGYLYVVDSYKGLLRVNTTTGEVQTLVSNEQGSEGVPFRFLNSLDISDDGFIYFTDSSYKWDRRNFRYEVLETHQAGRVLKYDVTSGHVTTLVSSLYLANGLALSADQTFLLVAEMSVARIRRIYLKGLKAGTNEIFVDNLPGFPDNIKINARGTFYVGMGSVRFEGSSPLGSFLDLVAPYPGAKRLIATVTPLFLYNIFMPKHALAIELNTDGRIVGSFHDPGAVCIGAVSELFDDFNGTVFIGHYQSPYVGILNVSQLDHG